MQRRAGAEGRLGRPWSAPPSWATWAPITRGRKRSSFFFFFFAAAADLLIHSLAASQGVLWFLRLWKETTGNRDTGNGAAVSRAPMSQARWHSGPQACGGPGAGHPAATLTSAQTLCRSLSFLTHQMGRMPPAQGVGAERAAIGEGRLSELVVIKSFPGAKLCAKGFVWIIPANPHETPTRALSGSPRWGTETPRVSVLPTVTQMSTLEPGLEGAPR